MNDRAAHQSPDRSHLRLISPILAFAAAALVGFGTHTLVRFAMDRDPVPSAPAPLTPVPDKKRHDERGSASPARQDGVRPRPVLYTLPTRSLDADTNARRAFALNDLA